MPLYQWIKSVLLKLFEVRLKFPILDGDKFYFRKK